MSKNYLLSALLLAMTLTNTSFAEDPMGEMTFGGEGGGGMSVGVGVGGFPPTTMPVQDSPVQSKVHAMSARYVENIGEGMVQFSGVGIYNNFKFFKDLNCPTPGSAGLECDTFYLPTLSGFITVENTDKDSVCKNLTKNPDATYNPDYQGGDKPMSDRLIDSAPGGLYLNTFSIDSYGFDNVGDQIRRDSSAADDTQAIYSIACFNPTDKIDGAESVLHSDRVDPTDDSEPAALSLDGE